ncbi:hypothetical protein [Flagellimonas sp.]|uniref:hypothetical protein n=1 Tax=Flagellimonas sp. TaxID=2058762 RepID=UPI003BB1F06F
MFKWLHAWKFHATLARAAKADKAMSPPKWYIGAGRRFAGKPSKALFGNCLWFVCATWNVWETVLWKLRFGAGTGAAR